MKDRKRIKSKKLNIFQKKGNFNKILFILSIIIGILGVFFILTASSYLTIKYNLSQYYYAQKQLIFLILGILIMFITSKIDYKIYKKYSRLMYILSIILLVLCYVPFFSVSFNGAKRAIRLFFITFMPSDIAKITAILFLSLFLVKNRKNRSEFLRGILPIAAIIGMPFVLILMQTDLSTSIVLLATLATIYFIYGYHKNHLPYIIAALVLGIIFGKKILQGYQLDRIIAFLDPESYYDNISWQVLNGLFSVSRGGITGVGFGNSIFKQGYLSNEVYNDMIFAVIAEEFGFIGSFIFIILIFSITYQIIKISLQSKDMFAKLVSLGVGILYFTQSFVNIGVAISIIPNTGITLPFVSFGGTSLIIYYFMIGIVLNISRRNDQIEIEENQIKKQLNKELRNENNKLFREDIKY